MSHSNRMLDLMAARATEGLSETETQELARLIAGQIELTIDDLDEAAAAADLAFEVGADKLETMPTGLKRSILSDAPSHLPPTRIAGPGASRPGLLSARDLGWYAAAAMLVLGLWAPWAERVEPPAVARSEEERREALLAEADDVIRLEWSPPEIDEYARVKGDVVWSHERQAGFMRLSGLPVNLPQEAQYQLWIVDPSRDRHPIDGGVFDIVDASGEVIVPIDAKLEVSQAAAFAVTLEKPGGVVVSDGPLLVVASAT